MSAKAALTATVRAVKSGKFIPHKAPLTLVSSRVPYIYLVLT